MLERGWLGEICKKAGCNEKKNEGKREQELARPVFEGFCRCVCVWWRFFGELRGARELNFFSTKRGSSGNG